MATQDTIGAMIEAKNMTAPRITPADIQAAVLQAHYFTAWQGAQLAYWADSDPAAPKPVEGEPDRTGPLSTLTFCVLELQNGFTVTGESACASPENFDAEIGRKIARKNAEEKIWPLLGYALKVDLHRRVKFDASPK
ncbi:Gp49 family protein [Janthinobacterium sp. PSPC3-1]|uniref:Gp49 family protein n=1 Tax=Janthinobacterium sp. PSPC3-1 TaxID=2804653 RepID=UPI003CE8B147